MNLFLALGLVAGLLTVSGISQRPGRARLLWILGCGTGLIGARLAAAAEAPSGLTTGGLSSLGLGAGFVVGAWGCGKLLYCSGLAGLLDDLTPGLAIALVLGRVGCFLTGCHYGSVTAVPWAVTYGPASAAYAGQLSAGQIDWLRSESLPVHPLPLYEGGLALLGLLVLLHFGWRIRDWLNAGALLPLSIAGYAGLRVAAEIELGAAQAPPAGWLAAAVTALATSLWIVSTRPVQSGV